MKQQQLQQQKHRLPFDILPTQSLRPCKRDMMSTTTTTTTTTATHNNNNSSPIPLQSVSSNSSSSAESAQPKELDEATGLAILKYIYEHKGSVSFEQRATKKPQQQQQQQETTHRPTFYMGEVEEKRGSSGGGAAESSVALTLGKLSNLIGIQAALNIKRINLALLRENGLTIAKLITECKVLIPRLKTGGVLKSYEDLLALKFTLQDLVRDRALFDVNKLAMFSTQTSPVSYEKMRRHIQTGFTIVDLIQCQFYTSELMTLGFSFDYLIRRRRIDKEQLAVLNYSLTDLFDKLGVTREHLKMLEITEKDAVRHFRWDREEYRQYISDM